MEEREITSRIRIDQLQPLLETTIERVTAPMPAVTLEELLQPEPAPPPPIQITFRTSPPASVVPAYPESAESSDYPEHIEAEVAGATLGVINGVPVHGCRPDTNPATDDVIDAAVDAAIDAEIHFAEIEAAIDAVTLAQPPAIAQPRYMAFAFGVAAVVVAALGLFVAI